MKIKTDNFFLLIILFTISCKEPARNIDTKNKQLFCKKAIVTNIIGNNRFFGFSNNITIYCSIEHNEELKGKLLIDPPLFGESYTPFKVNDEVLVKFYGKIEKGKEKNIIRMFLMKRINRNGNLMEVPFTFEEICNNGFPKEINIEGLTSTGKDE